MPSEYVVAVDHENAAFAMERERGKDEPTGKHKRAQETTTTTPPNRSTKRGGSRLAVVEKTLCFVPFNLSLSHTPVVF